MATLRIRLLDTLDIHCDDLELPRPPTLKSQSLLAYLVLHRYHPQSRDRLAGLFWGDRPERKARASLSTALWHIRRCFAPHECITGDAHAARFEFPGELWLDVEQFESQASRQDLHSLQTAAALYRGELLLDGFYDDWIVGERYRLEGLFLQVLARLMTAYEFRDEHQAALVTALRLLRRDSLHEDAHRVAMRAYSRLGQQGAALTQYQRCQEILRDELGIEPAPETTELYQAILEGQFVGEPLPAPAVDLAPVEPPPVAARHPLDALTPVRLVGRDQELAWLWATRQDSETHPPGLVLIGGQAGVGKTRLVEAFAQGLRQHDVQVLWGRCYAFERLLAFQPITEALEPVLATLTPDQRSTLPSWVLAELACQIPELIQQWPDVAAPEPIAPDQQAERRFAAVAHVLALYSTHKDVLLVLEDLHWASESTLQLLHYLVRKLAGHPLLFVGTFRPEEVEGHHPLRELQQQLRQEDKLRVTHLSPLSEKAIAEMVRLMSGAGPDVAPLAARLYRETEGNPFYLMELVKTLFEMDAIHLAEGRWQGDFAQLSRGTLPIPATVTEAIRVRTHRTSQPTREALDLAAVLGREFDFELLDVVWNRGTEATLEALDELLRRRLIVEGTGSVARDYAFTHHLIQEALYTGIPRRRRQFLHQQAGSALETLAGDATPAVAGELAFHYRHGQQWEKAAIWAERAGDHSAAQHAAKEAIDYYSQALEALQEAGQHASEQELRLLVKRARSRVADADFTQAQADLEGAVARAEAAESVDLQIQPLLVLAELHFLRMNAEPLLAAAGQARMLAERAEEERAIGLALRWESAGLYLAGRFQESVECACQAIELLSHANDVEEQGWAQVAAGAPCQDGLGDYVRARAHLEAARELFAASGSTLGEINAHHCLGNLCLYTGDLEEAVEHFETALQMAVQLGYRAQEPIELAHLALAHALLGALDVARQYGERCLQASREHGIGHWEYYALFWLGFVEQETGNLDAAGELFEQLSGPAGPFALNQLSLLHRERGEEEHWRTALELAQEAAAKAQSSHGKPRDQIYALSNQAMAQLALGDPVAALACSRQAMDLAARGSAEWVSQEVLFNHAQVLRANDLDDEARRALQEAHDEVVAKASKIRDDQLRDGFLRNVRINRAILAEHSRETP